MATRVSSPVLVGRAGQLSALDAAFAQAGRGSPPTVLLGGEAGVGGELFISVKTASVHVSNILGKLGVASRGEAAATAHRLRLFDSFPAQDPHA